MRTVLRWASLGPSVACEDWGRKRRGRGAVWVVEVTMAVWVVEVMDYGLCFPVTCQCGRHTAEHPESQEFEKGTVTQQDEPGSFSAFPTVTADPSPFTSQASEFPLAQQGFRMSA